MFKPGDVAVAYAESSGEESLANEADHFASDLADPLRPETRVYFQKRKAEGAADARWADMTDCPAGELRSKEIGHVANQIGAAGPL